MEGQSVASSAKPTEHSDEYVAAPEAVPAVRFASTVEQLSPDSQHAHVEPVQDADPDPRPRHSDVTSDQIKELSQSLQDSNLQEQRMGNFSYQPFSLPPSRVHSHESSPTTTPQQTLTPAERHSPKMASGPEIVSPPLTPAGTSGLDTSPAGRSLKPVNAQSDGAVDASAITPQASGQDSAPESPRIGLPQRRASAENTTATDQHESHRRSMFSIGPGGSSVPVSRESSPSRKRASAYYSQPFTPAGDLNDPYAASKRAPQSRSAANIDSRFVFSRKKGRPSPTSSTSSLVRPGEKPEKRHSAFLGVLNKGGSDLYPAGTESTTHSRNASMSDLRRFFKIGGSHKPKKSVSPAPSEVKRPPISSARSAYQVPFADDHGLTSKYGKIGRVLGSGAGGSVKLMRRHEDNTVFAVKEFRPRHTYETEKEYVKKLTAEFCMGSALHHGNVIETLDIVQEKGKWYEVMEYAPFDLFAIVMTGKMSKPEVACCFLQILNGVTYLHSMGLAHRDLKLDNVVVSDRGIMKIIDFGSAHVFKYPFESDIVLATGVVGSDPYLAPEVYEERRYDPQAVDIWSLAIIYACMSLRRFPWKLPRVTDNSYKLFASEPTPGHDPKKLILPSRSTTDLANIPQRDMFPENDSKQHHHDHKSDKSSATNTVGSNPSTQQDASASGSTQKEVIRGPWRLLRLLPRESRHVMSRMLAINPRERATMKEILEDPWVSDTVICRQEGPGLIDSATDHTHILEPPAPQSK